MITLLPLLSDNPVIQSLGSFKKKLVQVVVVGLQLRLNPLLLIIVNVGIGRASDD